MTEWRRSAPATGGVFKTPLDDRPTLNEAGIDKNQPPSRRRPWRWDRGSAIGGYHDGRRRLARASEAQGCTTPSICRVDTADGGKNGASCAICSETTAEAVNRPKLERLKASEPTARDTTSCPLIGRSGAHRLSGSTDVARHRALNGARLNTHRRLVDQATGVFETPVDGSHRPRAGRPKIGFLENPISEKPPTLDEVGGLSATGVSDTPVDW